MKGAYSNSSVQIQYSKKELFTVFVVLGVSLLFLYFRTPAVTYTHPDFRLSWDHHSYIYMATHNLFDYFISPYSWRILNPLLAKYLPFEVGINFRILNFMSLWGTSLFIFMILRTLGFARILSLSGALFFISLGWVTSTNLYNFWLTDSLAFLFSVAGIWAIYSKHNLLFICILALGVTAKESVIFIAPLMYTLNANRVYDKRLFMKTIYYSLPAIIILFLIRFLVPSLNGVESYVSTLPDVQRGMHVYTFTYMINTIAGHRFETFSFQTIITFTVGTFGVSLIFLPILFFRSNWRVLLRYLPIILLYFLSILFAVNTERLLVGSFIVFIIMAVSSIRELCLLTKTSTIYSVLLPITLILFHGFKNAFVLSSLLESAILLLFIAFLINIKENDSAITRGLKLFSLKLESFFEK